MRAEGVALRRLLTGGDRLHRAPRAGLPFELVNHYGPTECAVVSTAYVVTPRPTSTSPGSGAARSTVTAAPPPIGRPIDNVQAFVLDPHQQPVAAGVPGELHLAGEGLARGYLHQPDLTATQFVTSPHPPHQRLYRTGDLARRLPDGNLHYLGRIDQQIKLRGFRIEPGEINAALTSHPHVRAATTILREDHPGDPRLVSYITTTTPTTPDHLRHHLRQHLPDYMHPAHLVTLPTLPTTPHGKIDTRALPPPRITETDHVSPRTDTERTLTGIWKEVAAPSRPRRHPRQLLRPRRPLAPGGPTPRAHPDDAGCRTLPLDALRCGHARRPRRRGGSSSAGWSPNDLAHHPRLT